MDKLIREFNSIENSIAKYIYLKYIQSEKISIPIDTINTSTHTNMNKEEENEEEDEEDDDDEAEEDIDEDNKDEDNKDEDNKDEDNKDEDNNEEEDDNEENTKEIKIQKKQKPKIQDKTIYKLYLQNIFHRSRKCFTLNQTDIIKDDIQTMEIANKAYERNPKEFKISNFDLPPDLLRCSFIRKHNHRYYRCKNRISCDDSDVCKKHIDSENIYYDKYNELLEQFP